MKVCISKKVYDQFDEESRRRVQAVPCGCGSDGKTDPQCDSCDGDGTVYEFMLSTEESAAIEQNLRSQGVPLGKDGTH